MTWLIAFSILLIAGSAIALVIGWIGASEPAIVASIVMSVSAGVCLAAGYARSRRELRAATRTSVRRSHAERAEARPEPPAGQPAAGTKVGHSTEELALPDAEGGLPVYVGGEPSTPVSPGPRPEDDAPDEAGPDVTEH